MTAKILVSILLLSLGQLAIGQLPELVRQTETLETEIKLLTDASEEGQLQVYTMLSLARNQYHLDNYTEAEKQYLKVITDPVCTTLDYKALAICLRQNGKTSLANEFYEAYTKTSEGTTFKQIWNSDNRPSKGITRPIVNKLTQYDFIYGSVNPNGSTNLNIDHGTVTGNISCESFINLEAVQFPVESFNNLGSFTKGEKSGSYYYSYKKTNGYYGIYYLEFKKNKWTKARELILGEPSANYCFPFFLNGNLFFSSDKGGGHGLFDLYSAKVQGKNPIEIGNLGPQINTDKNEILPSVYDGLFGYSSNGLPGQGGYDMYYSDWSFQRIRSIPYPFNTTADEFILIQKDKEKASLFRGTENKINLVRVSYYVDYLKTLNGQVVDKQSNGLKNARILLTKSFQDQGIFQTSSSDGTFSVVIPDTINSWMIECHKVGFIKSNLEIDITTLGENPLIIVLSPIKPVEPEPIFIVSSKSKNVIPAEPQVSNDSISQTLNDDSTFTEVNNTGRFYIVLASTKKYETAYAIWDKRRLSYPNIEILKNDEMHVYRVGIFAGTSYKEAMTAHRKTRKTVSDAWILRPDMQ
jgi:hypothetical protein